MGALVDAVDQVFTSGAIRNRALIGGGAGAAVGSYRDDTGMLEGALKGAAIGAASGFSGGAAGFIGKGAAIGGLVGGYRENNGVFGGMLKGAALGGGAFLGVSHGVPRAIEFGEKRFVEYAKKNPEDAIKKAQNLMNMNEAVNAAATQFKIRTNGTSEYTLRQRMENAHTAYKTARNARAQAAGVAP